MADIILRGGLYYPRWVTGDKLVQIKSSNVDAYVGSRLRQAQVIDASNVADFYYARSNHRDWDPYHDFPNVAPPFPPFWVEMRCPQVLLNDSTRKTEGRLPFAFGCLVEVQRGEPGRRTLRNVTASPPEGTEQLLEELAPTIGQSLQRKEHQYDGSSLWQHLTPEEKQYLILIRMFKDAARREQSLANFPDNGWTCVIDVLVEEQKGMVFGPLGCCVLTVGSSGELIYLSRGLLHFRQASGCLLLSFEDLHTIEGAMSPLLLAISFLHCRNVGMKEIKSAGPRRKRYLARYGIEPVRYCTLEIQTMRDVLRREGEMEGGAGLQRALHICRGHFRTYRDRGLFGKYKGTFWTPMHLRGTAEEGVISKDYEIARPTQSETRPRSPQV